MNIRFRSLILSKTDPVDGKDVSVYKPHASYRFDFGRPLPRRIIESHNFDEAISEPIRAGLPLPFRLNVELVKAVSVKFYHATQITFLYFLERPGGGEEGMRRWGRRGNEADTKGGGQQCDYSWLNSITIF